jgi:protein-disulfide isomerase
LASCNRTLVFFLLVSLGCPAQLSPTELGQRIERQFRIVNNIPASIHVFVSFPGEAGEFPNYDTVTVTLESGDKNQNYGFLLSKDRKTLVHLTRIDLRQDRYAEAMKKIDLKRRPVRGNPNAKVVALSYDDFQCPFCARVHQTLFPQLLMEYGDRVAFIYKDFPLSEIHSWATHAAVNGNCLAVQNGDAYWDFVDFIHNNQRAVNSQKDPDSQFGMLDQIAMTEPAKFALDTAKLQSCVKAQDENAVKESVKEGESLGVSGTPVMFLNGEMIDGAQPASAFRTAFDRALQDVALSTSATPSVCAPASASAGSALPDSAAHTDQR